MLPKRLIVLNGIGRLITLKFGSAFGASLSRLFHTDSIWTRSHEDHFCITTCVISSCNDYDARSRS